MALYEFGFLDSYLSTKSEATDEIAKKIQELDEKANSLQASLSKAPHFDNFKPADFKTESSEFDLKLKELEESISGLEEGFNVLSSVVKPRIP